MKILVLFDVQRWMWIAYVEMNGYDWAEQLDDQKCGRYTYAEMEMLFSCALLAFERAGQYL